MADLAGSVRGARTGADQSESEATYIVKSAGSIVFDVQVSDLVIDRARTAGLGTRMDIQGLE